MLPNGCMKPCLLTGNQDGDLMVTSRCRSSRLLRSFKYSMSASVRFPISRNRLLRIVLEGDNEVTFAATALNGTMVIHPEVTRSAGKLWRSVTKERGEDTKTSDGLFIARDRKPHRLDSAGLPISFSDYNFFVKLPFPSSSNSYFALRGVQQLSVGQVNAVTNKPISGVRHFCERLARCVR